MIHDEMQPRSKLAVGRLLADELTFAVGLVWFGLVWRV
jgi:hypothetical protein